MTVSKRNLWLSAAGLGVLLVVGGAVPMWYVREQAQQDIRHDLAWLRYGAPPNLRQQADRWFPMTYPMLLDWSQRNDPIRQQYALEVIRSKGQPYSFWWLTTQLKRNPDTGTLGMALSNDEQYPDWQKTLGLNDLQKRAEATQLALAGVDSNREGYGQFNIEFLRALGVEAARAIVETAKQSSPERARVLLAALPYDYKDVPPEVAQAARQLQSSLPSTGEYRDWSKDIEKLTDLEALNIFYNRLTIKDKRNFLEGAFFYGTPSALHLQFLNQVLQDVSDPLRVLVATILMTQEDRRGFPVLEQAVNGDFRALAGITNRLVLLRLATEFPTSRFTQACRTYGNIRGGTYFGDYRFSIFEEAEQAIQAPSPSQARAEERRWRQWLAQYPHHPGHDDGGYWLGRTLMWQGKRTAALYQFAQMLVVSPPDGDMQIPVRNQLLWLLDVGTSEVDLQSFLKQYPQHPLAPAVQYAQAVRRARVHDYPGALTLTMALDLKKSLELLKPPYFAPDASLYPQQQQQWQRLAALVGQNPISQLTPNQIDQVVALWSQERGYLNGYLVLYGGARGGGNGTEDSLLPNLAQNYRQANALGVALDLSAQILRRTTLTPELKEKTQFRQINLLYRLYQSYPDGEVSVMHPLPQFSAQVGADLLLYRPTPSEAETQYQPWQSWYIRQVAHLTAQLPAQSHYGDDALITLYEMTGRSSYLQQLVKQYPQNDRVEEAKAALYMQAKNG